MSLFENPEHLRLLQNLLNPQQRTDNDDSETDDDEESTLMPNNLNPASIGPPKLQEKNCINNKPQQHDQQQQQQKPKPDITTIEQWQAQQEKEDRELLETRKSPEFKISYRQAVGTEDVFLQMGNRSSASASCEDMVLVILMPEETVAADKMDLTISEEELDLATPVYRLKLPLPHRVNVDRCSAQYESDERRLCLKLRMQRELDFINF